MLLLRSRNSMSVAHHYRCLLRVICEASHTPSHRDGLVGDAINGLLLPPHVLHLIPEYGQSEYIGAQRAGHGKTGDCSGFHQGCPTSFFQVCMRA